MTLQGDRLLSTPEAQSSPRGRSYSRIRAQLCEGPQHYHHYQLYVCDLCQFHSENKGHMVRHVDSNKHNQSATCNECQQVFPNPVSLAKHTAMLHNSTAPNIRSSKSHYEIVSDLIRPTRNMLSSYASRKACDGVSSSTSYPPPSPRAGGYSSSQLLSPSPPRPKQTEPPPPLRVSVISSGPSTTDEVMCKTVVKIHVLVAKRRRLDTTAELQAKLDSLDPEDVSGQDEINGYLAKKDICLEWVPPQCPQFMSDGEPCQIERKSLTKMKPFFDVESIGFVQQPQYKCTKHGANGSNIFQLVDVISGKFYLFVSAINYSFFDLSSPNFFCFSFLFLPPFFPSSSFSFSTLEAPTGVQLQPDLVPSRYEKSPIHTYTFITRALFRKILIKQLSDSKLSFKAMQEENQNTWLLSLNSKAVELSESL